MKDDDPKKQLLKLIEELKLPLPREEARENMENLSKDEIRELVNLYTEAKNYQDEVDSFTRDLDPQKYAEVHKGYYQKLDKLDEDYGNKMEGVQASEDERLDKAEEKTSQEIDDLVEKNRAETDELINTHKQLYSKLDKAMDED